MYINTIFSSFIGSTREAEAEAGQAEVLGEAVEVVREALVLPHEDALELPHEEALELPHDGVLPTRQQYCAAGRG